MIEATIFLSSKSGRALLIPSHGNTNDNTINTTTNGATITRPIVLIISLLDSPPIIRSISPENEMNEK